MRACLTLLALFTLSLAVVSCGGQGDIQRPSRTGDRPLYVVGTNPEYPPMQFIDNETGQMVGYEVDLMNAIAEAGGFDIEWRSIEWRGIFAALDAKDIDAIMSAATITDERRQRFNFSEPYHTISQRLVIQRRNLGDINEITDLEGRLIGVQMGTTGMLLVENEYPQWRTATYENTPLAFADLRNGRIFGFMVDEPVAEEYTRANPEAAEFFASLPFRFSEEHYGIVIRKGEPELLQRINDGLRKVQESGIVSDLQEKWLQ